MRTVGGLALVAIIIVNKAGVEWVGFTLPLYLNQGPILPHWSYLPCPTLSLPSTPSCCCLTIRFCPQPPPASMLSPRSIREGVVSKHDYVEGTSGSVDPRFLSSSAPRQTTQAVGCYIHQLELPNCRVLHVRNR